MSGVFRGLLHLLFRWGAGRGAVVVLRVLSGIWGLGLRVLSSLATKT